MHVVQRRKITQLHHIFMCDFLKKMAVGSLDWGGKLHILANSKSNN